MAICEISSQAQEGHREKQGAIFSLGKDEDATSWSWSSSSSWSNMIQLCFFQKSTGLLQNWLSDGELFDERQSGLTDLFGRGIYWWLQRGNWGRFPQEGQILMMFLDVGTCNTRFLPMPVVLSSIWVSVLEYSLRRNIWNQHWQSRIIPGVPCVCREFLSLSIG